MLRLTDAEIESLRKRQANRRMAEMRSRFVAINTSDLKRGPYFDENIYVCDLLEGLSEVDVLLLLRIGYTRNCLLPDAPEFQECQKRGRWYGRRLWLQDRLEKLEQVRLP